MSAERRLLDTRDGSGNLYQQFTHGTQYIDELVMIRVKDKGDLYVHQDANWNVIGLTDLGGHLVERYVLTPYGEPTVYQETGYGDRDGDGDVDATDKGTPGSTCTGTVSGECRILDLDFDGDYDNDDATKFDNLPQGLARHPGRIATAVHQPFAHQGLLHEPELGQYQNRFRQYDPAKRRFLQRDPLAVNNRAQSGYQDGLNLVQYLRSNPVRLYDPLGADCPPGSTVIGSYGCTEPSDFGPTHIGTDRDCVIVDKVPVGPVPCPVWTSDDWTSCYTPTLHKSRRGSSRGRS